MENVNKNFETILEFQQLVKNPDWFLEGSNSLCDKIKTSLKRSYDISKCEELQFIKSSALPELIIKNFDFEQLWQQIELQNDTVLNYYVTNISKLIINKSRLLFTNLEYEIQITKDGEDSERSFTNKFDDKSSSISDIESSDLETNSTVDQKNNEEQNYNVDKKKSSVDDDFFNLNEMEDFLKIEEKKIQDSGNSSEESLSEGEDNVDLFDSNSDEDDKIETAKFKDFFIAKDDKKLKHNKIMEVVNSTDEVANNITTENKSSLELRQERLQKRIEEIEQNNVNEKPWQLKGEVTADRRPQNSLLEEIVEFDLTSRPAPIITEQTTLQLEDIIKQRIKDRVFDSVERKVKLLETPVEFRKKLILDQEKSKHSLAQIYEKEFLDQQASLDPENKDKEELEPESHREIKTLMKSLFNKLDSLSNFHFTPKPAIPELRIINNLPAISIEEVAPVVASDTNLLAPEEVKSKVRGGIVGKTERTATDKNRERRKKKQKQHAHLKEKQKCEKFISKLNAGLDNKYSKEKSKKLIQHITKDKNTGRLDESSTSAKSIKSSKAFFTQLQEEAQSHINNKVKNKITKNKHEIKAKKIKL